MKINRKKIFIALIMVFVISFISIGVYSNTKKILTKKQLFDNIGSIEKIIISCMTREGKNSLDDELKIDFTIKYIIENKDKYSSIIKTTDKLSFNENFTEYYVFGKVHKEDLKKVCLSFFCTLECNVEEYKYYDDDYIYLVYMPCDNPSLDLKEVIYHNKNSVTIKYSRCIEDINNSFLVDYIYNENGKIEDIIIYNSKIGEHNYEENSIKQKSKNYNFVCNYLCCCNSYIYSATSYNY